MTTSELDLRLTRFRSRRDEYPHSLASALLDAGRSRDALEVIHLGLLDDESDPELRTLEGRAFYQQGDLHEAQAALLRAAKANPQSKEPYRWLAQVLLGRGDPTRALQVLERAITLDPADRSLHEAHARALHLFALSDPEAGQQELAPEASAPPQPGPTGSLRERLAAPPSSPHFSLPFEDEVERDDELPTRAIEIRDDLRTVLRSELPEAAFFPPGERSHDDEDEGSEATAIIPAARELELLGARPAGASSRAPDREVRSAERADKDLRADKDARADKGGRPSGRRSDRPRKRASSRPAKPESVRPRAPESVAPELAPEPLPSRDELATQLHVMPNLAQPGEAEPPEEVLTLLRAQGVFEQPSASAATEGWASGAELPGGKRRVSRALVVSWGFALLAAAGGYYAFERWLGSRKGDADALVNAARVQLYDGQHESLRAAEQRLVEARALDPKSVDALSWLLLVQGARVLEESPSELPVLRQTLDRAEQLGVETPLVAVLETLALTPEARAPRLDAALTRVDREGSKDARASYLAGRLAQRAGRAELANKLLARAASLEPSFALPWLALGEQARAEGRLDAARDAFTRALGSDGKSLRAELWLLVLTARPNQGAELLRSAEAFAQRAVHAADPDRLFAETVRAFAQLSLGQTEAARATLRTAASVRVEDPELLAFLSEQALRAGDGGLAYRAAKLASDLAASAPRYQALVAAALLQQGHGAAAPPLASAGEGVGALALARAAAALLSDAREPLELAKRELASYRATPAGKADVEAGAQLMRLDLRLGANVESLMPAARALVERAPDKAAAHLALGEALIAAEQGAAAVTALEPALRIASGLADAHFMLGRALRLSGRHIEARRSFERAVAIAPNHLEARRALGRLLIEGGEHDAALALFRELESAAGPSAVLGVIEALLSKGEASEAAKRLEALPAPLQAAPVGVLLRARLALVRRQPLESLALLEPLLGEDGETRSAESLTLQGDALQAADRVELAATAYEAALELDPAHPDALLGRALAALRVEKADQALSLVKRAEASLASRPRSASTRALLLVIAGRAELIKQQMESARTLLAGASAIAGAPAESLFWYGEALARSKDPRAAEQYTKYLELEPDGPYAARAKRALSTP